MTDTTQAQWRQAGDGPRLQLTRRFSQPPEKVWDALTTPARLAAWMGVEWLGDPALSEGARFDYRFANTDMESRGRVLVFEPPDALEHSWFENIPPASIIRWALEPDGAGCLLTLTQRAGPPEDGPRTAAGWTQLLESLAAELDRSVPVMGGMDVWRRRRDAYAAAFPPEASRDGRRIEVDGKPALRFERRLAWPPAAVWKALVEPEAIRRWLQAEAVIDPVVGGRFQLVLGGGPSRMEGVVRRWEPPHVLEYTWPERTAGGDSIVRFELFPDGDHSRLVLTHVLLAGGDLREFASGWHWHLDALEPALAGETRTLDEPRFAALRRVYMATL